MLGWDNIVYCDTDSIFFIINKESINGFETMKKLNLIGKSAGQWEFDGYYVNFGSICPKKYTGLFCECSELTTELLDCDNYKFDIKYAGSSIIEPFIDVSAKDIYYETIKKTKTPKGSVLAREPAFVKSLNFVNYYTNKMLINMSADDIKFIIDKYENYEIPDNIKESKKLLNNVINRRKQLIKELNKALDAV